MVAPAAERDNGHGDKEIDGLFLPEWIVDWTRTMRVINSPPAAVALPAFLNILAAAVTVMGLSVTVLPWL